MTGAECDGPLVIYAIGWAFFAFIVVAAYKFWKLP